MNMNCLNFQGLRRTDSDTDLQEPFSNNNNNQEKFNFGLCLGRVERSWSGNLAPRPPYEKMSRNGVRLTAATSSKKVKRVVVHRVHNSGPVTFEDASPRLVRSCGMRRDWSFEDLRQALQG